MVCVGLAEQLRVVCRLLGCICQQLAAALF
jgi:hypothetical protein